MFVVSDMAGNYLKVGPTWRREWTPDLQKARTYPSTGAAKNSAAAAKYGRRRLLPKLDFEVLPVVLALAENS